MIINELALITGIDIPFPEAQLIIHQPTIKEIAFIGENECLNGCRLLTLEKEEVKMDKTILEQYSNFDVFMQMMSIPNKKLRADRKKVAEVLTLLFPQYHIEFQKDKIAFSLQDSEIELAINNENYEIFKKYVSDIFCLENLKNSENSEYNPLNKAAEEIAKKLERRHKKLQALGVEKPSDASTKSLYGRQISILAAARYGTFKELSEMTIYQLNEVYKRWQLRESYELYIKKAFSFGGAKEEDKPEDWMQDLHA